MSLNYAQFLIASSRLNSHLLMNLVSNEALF